MLASDLAENKIDIAASRIAPVNARPTERPNDEIGGVHAGRLTDALLGDRGERVVVDLRDQEPEPGAAQHQRDHEVEARVGAGDDRDHEQHADGEQQEPGADQRARPPPPALLPASSAMKNIVSDSGASDRPACSAL